MEIYPDFYQASDLLVDAKIDKLVKNAEIDRKIKNLRDKIKTCKKNIYKYEESNEKIQKIKNGLGEDIKEIVDNIKKNLGEAENLAENAIKCDSLGFNNAKSEIHENQTAVYNLNIEKVLEKLQDQKIELAKKISSCEIDIQKYEAQICNLEAQRK